jgi:hypothetical protein
MHHVFRLVFCVCCLVLAGCGDSASNYSKPVALNLKSKASDVTGTAVSAEKAINTESGNPYGAFVTEARARLGRDPARIEVSSLEVLLSTTSTGVAALNEVFNGATDVQFVLNDTNNVYSAAHATIDGSTAGRGPIAFAIAFDAAKMAASVDWQKFLGGGFKVVIAGPVAAGYSGKAAADLQLTLTFAAFP